MDENIANLPDDEDASPDAKTTETENTLPDVKNDPVEQEGDNA